MSVCRMAGLYKPASVAVLVFLAATAWARVVAAYLRLGLDGLRHVVLALRGACCLTLRVLTRIFFLVGGIARIVLTAFRHCGAYGRNWLCRRTARRNGYSVPSSLRLLLRHRGCLHLYRNLSAHQYGYGLGVHCVDHRLEEVERLELID